MSEQTNQDPELQADTLFNASSRLAHLLVNAPNDEYRHVLVKRIAKKLGDTDFPILLKLLCTIAQSNDYEARMAVSSTLADGLRRLDLPGGELTAWGGSSLWRSAGPNLDNYLPVAAPRRLLGPIEYLCVWYGQHTQRKRLSEKIFADSLRDLLLLIHENHEAWDLYLRKLQADAHSEIEGHYTKTTRDMFLQMTLRWEQGASIDDIVEAAIAVKKGKDHPRNQQQMVYNTM